MCFDEMFAFSTKQSPASFPAILFFIRLSISFACSIALLLSSRNMLRFFVFGVAIFLENWRRFSTAVSFPFLICFSFCLIFIVVSYLF